MKKSKEYTPFATTEDGKLYVEIQAVMNPLVAFVDALPMTFFGESKVAYMPVEDAIAWCRKEMDFHNREKYEAMIEIMEKFIAQESVSV